MSRWFYNSYERPLVVRRRYSPFYSSNMPYTYIIIVANIIIFLALLIMGFDPFFCEDNVCSVVALKSSEILQLKKVWTLFTSMFVHANLLHLMANMISLLFIGTFIEKLIGRKRFLYFYILSGIFAGIFFIGVSKITGIDLDVYSVGASGAIFGLGGLLTILTPKLPVLVFFIIPMPMWAAMLFLMFGLWAISLSIGLPIGNVAHLGGLICGVLYGLYLKKKYPRRAKILSDLFSG